jgi:hypothetical protein
VIKIASLALAAATSISMKISTVVYGYQRNIHAKSNTMVLEEKIEMRNFLDKELF